jgi:hypothetical protein
MGQRLPDTKLRPDYHESPKQGTAEACARKNASARSLLRAPARDYDVRSVMSDFR